MFANVVFEHIGLDNDITNQGTNKQKHSQYFFKLSTTGRLF